MSQRTASDSPFVAILTIKNGKITTNDTISTFVRGPVVWAVMNTDQSDYSVDIDYHKINHKGGGPGNPFGSTKHNSCDVPAAPLGGAVWSGIVDVIKDYQPGPKHDMYKYTVDLYQRNAIVDHLDPDIDVVDPYPFVDLVKGH